MYGLRKLDILSYYHLISLCDCAFKFQKLIFPVLLFSVPQDLSLPNGTPVDTSSPASSSSLLNRLQLDDDLDGEMRDLFVTVDDPKKHVCTMETYITYRVTTKVLICKLLSVLPCFNVRTFLFSFLGNSELQIEDFHS